MERNELAHNQTRPAATVTVASEESDELLAARVAADPAAFAELYRRYVGRIDQYCRYRLRDHDLAQDATSQIFLKALEGLRRKRVEHVASWLFSIAHNEVIDRYRRQRQETAFDQMVNVASADLSPEDLAIIRSESSDLRKLLPLLTSDQQRVVELRLAGLTTQEIQDVLGKGRSWVGTTQFRALRRLRDVMNAAQDKEAAS